jgi:AcrR family transcriptional regulator
MDPADQPDPHGQPAARRCRADHKESVRRVILDAARELFVCEGYGSVSLRKIARRIGYTPMAIYVHFRDKSEILDCICEESFTCFRANAERLDRLALAPRERLAAGLRFYVDFGLQHPHHYQLTFMTPPCGSLTLGRRNEIGQDCYRRMRGRVALCVAPEAVLQALAAERSTAAMAPAAATTLAAPERQVAAATLPGVLDLPGLPRPPATTEALATPEIAELAESPEVELASQTIWTAVHGLVSLLIARPEFQWFERERLIASVIENALQALGPATGEGPASW